MKKIIFLGIVVSLCLQNVWAQSSYTAECWFDNQYDQRRETTSPTGSLWQMQLDVSDLGDGMHTLFLHLRDTAGRYSVPRSFLFFKMADTDGSPFAMRYDYWFDDDYDHHGSDTLRSQSLLLDVSSLRDGMHTLNLQLGEGAAAELHSYLFFKSPMVETKAFAMRYDYWFDDDYDHHGSDTLRSQSLLLDVAGLRDGMHTLNLQLGEGAAAELHSY
ncbi:MAG: hypothetical protein IJ745_02095, partial [Bacteroidales bacterium]|nr:hypothetical protein [Bacteroidales bacterium]